MRPELILWDWNGTLLDDVELCVDALNRLLARFGYPQRYDREQYRAIFGFPVQDYYARAGFDFARHSFDELARSFMEDYIPASAACPPLAAVPDQRHYRGHRGTGQLHRAGCGSGQTD